MRAALKKMKNLSILLAICMIGLGLFLVLRPDTGAAVICRIFGWIMALCGGAAVVASFWQGAYPYNITELFLGMVCVLAGVFILSNPMMLAALLGTILGALLLIHGVCGLSQAGWLRRQGVETWWASMLLALVTVLLGVFLMWSPLSSPRIMMVIAGLSLLYDGISNLLTVRRISGIVKELRDEQNGSIIDADPS